MSSVHEILRKYWGFEHFRPQQEAIIHSVMEGRDTLALLPTGGGKSVCYQVPALCMDGLTLVISPLIALMNDQVGNLISKGIQAAAITSFMSKREIDITLDNSIYGKTKLLYISPERLSSELFQVRTRKMKIAMIAVDEAHCISQWGYDFRPAYLEIASIRRLHPDAPVLALTATATPKVASDLKDKLLFRKNSRAFISGFGRDNLAYRVMYEEDKHKRLLEIIKNPGGSGIIYVRSRKKTKLISDYLKQKKIPSDYYHAGLKAKERNQKQEAWQTGKDRIIVATNAFGMGIDKPDVRFVVHMDLPDCIESYFQEAGRCGRDGKKASAVLLFQKADELELKKMLSFSFPEPAEISSVYQSLANFFQVAVGAGEGTGFDFDFPSFCTQYNLNPLKTYSSLNFLEREGYLSVSEDIKLGSRIYITASADELYSFQLENSNYDPLVKLLLRSYAGLFDGYIKINETALAKRWGKPREELIRALNFFQKRGLLSYLPETNSPQLTFLLPRADANHLHISPKTRNFLKKLAEERAAAMLRYVNSRHRCRSQMLLDYFGEENSKPCGICDVCTGLNDASLSNAEYKDISIEINKLLSAGPVEIQTLAEKITRYPEMKLLKTVRWMSDNGNIVQDDEYRLRLKS